MDHLLRLRKLGAVLALLTAAAVAQTTTTVTGTIKDLTQTLVTSGKVTFTLQPSRDTTISGVARFFPQTVVCLINASGQVVAQDGVSVCTITMNTALQPTGTYYRVDIWPFNVKTSSFTFYAVLANYDWSTVVPTPTTSPAQNFVDIFSNQTIGGNKIWSGTQTYSAANIFNAPVTSTQGWLTNFLQSTTASPAQSGFMRQASSDQTCWRNVGNSADLCLGLDFSSNLLWSSNTFSFGSPTATVATSIFPATNNQSTGSSLSLIAGQGTSISTGGQASLSGGAGGGSTGNGGNVVIGGGSGGGSGTGGTIFLNAGTGGTNGTLSTNTTISRYNNIATAANGVSAIVAADNAASLGANYNAGSAKSLVATPKFAGMYKISGVQYIFQAATTSSTFPSLTLGWTDQAGMPRTLQLVATSTTNTTAVITTFSTVVNTSNVNPLTLTSASYASSGATPMMYILVYTVEQLM